ncbi:MAG: ribosome biogenesis GTPase Der [Parcubacteria group bacterium]|nr:ribosome biogenesis GTPase Der [Parcubacteria group bacterium]
MAPSLKGNLPTVVIIGRPNVGKSTLLNRIAGRTIALTSPTPFTTRDPLEAVVTWNRVAFRLIDTGGLTDTERHPFAQFVATKIDEMLDRAALVIVMLDAKEASRALTDDDRAVIEKVRKLGKPSLVALNKIESLPPLFPIHDFARLGLGEVIAVSALTGRGVGDLLDAITARLATAEIPEVNPRYRIAIVGRPNVGKSTLFNALIGEKRAIVTPIPGTTVDRIESTLSFENTLLTLSDTAGIRRKGNIASFLERLSVGVSLDSIRESDLLILVLDAHEGLLRQDIRLLRLAETYHKSLLLIINKIDLAAIPQEALAKKIAYGIPSFWWVPVIFISAERGTNVGKVLPMTMSILNERLTRMSQETLDRLARTVQRQFFMPRSRPIDAKHLRGVAFTQIENITQRDTDYPSFVVTLQHGGVLKPHHRIAVANVIRETVPFRGSPIEILIDYS